MKQSVYFINRSMLEYILSYYNLDKALNFIYMIILDCLEEISVLQMYYYF